jgi:hypothetical protein
MIYKILNYINHNKKVLIIGTVIYFLIYCILGTVGFLLIGKTLYYSIIKSIIINLIGTIFGFPINLTLFWLGHRLKKYLEGR